MADVTIVNDVGTFLRPGNSAARRGAHGFELRSKAYRPNTGADPTSRSTLGLYKSTPQAHRHTRVHNWSFYFSDPPIHPGMAYITKS